MEKQPKINRREALKTIGAGVAGGLSVLGALEIVNNEKEDVTQGGNNPDLEPHYNLSVGQREKILKLAKEKEEKFDELSRDWVEAARSISEDPVGLQLDGSTIQTLGSILQVTGSFEIHKRELRDALQKLAVIATETASAQMTNDLNALKSYVAIVEKDPKLRSFVDARIRGKRDA